ncbi:MAG: chemotaxis protein CheX [Bacillota bacterium]
MSGRFDLNALQTIFSEVLTNTTQVFMGIELLPCAAPAPDADISGLLILIGEQPIVIRIAVSSAAAGHFVSLMTGIAETELSEALVSDGIAELTNIVSGRAKAIINADSARYRLTPPAIIEGNSHRLLFKSRTAGFCQNYRSSDGRFGLTFELIYV